MRIWAKNIRSEIIDIYITPNTTIREIKEKLSHLIDIEPQFIKIVFKGIVLQDDITIETYGIEEDSTVFYSIPHGRVELSERRKKSKYQQEEPETFIDKVTNSAIGQQMMKMIDENPQMYEDMFKQIPNFEDVADSNPELTHVLRDGDEITEQLKMQTTKGNKKMAAITMDNMFNQIESSGISMHRVNRMIGDIADPLLEGVFRRPQHKTVIPKEKLESPSVLPLSTMQNAAISNAKGIESKQELAQAMSKINSGIFKLRSRHIKISKTSYYNVRDLIAHMEYQKYKPVFAKELGILFSKGFVNEDDNIRALMSAGGKIQQAIKILMKSERTASNHNH